MEKTLTRLGEDLFIANHFLSQKECNDFIQQGEEIGFEKADVQLSEGRALLNNIRNNERANYYSEELADLLWQRLSSSIYSETAPNFPSYNNLHASGLSPYFRFYKYFPEQKFNMHKDGRQTVHGKTTYMTFLIYLNSNMTGGETAFRKENIKIQPEAGNALLFEHHQWHSGCKLEEGIKYVLRTDVVFG